MWNQNFPRREAIRLPPPPPLKNEKETKSKNKKNLLEISVPTLLCGQIIAPNAMIHKNMNIFNFNFVMKIIILHISEDRLKMAWIFALKSKSTTTPTTSTTTKLYWSIVPVPGHLQVLYSTFCIKGVSRKWFPAYSGIKIDS